MYRKIIVVLGCSGMLGHKLLQTLNEREDFLVYGTVRTISKSLLNCIKVHERVNIIPNIDIDNLTGIRNLLEEVKPIAVINCIGLVSQDALGADPISNLTVNSLFPHKLEAIVNQIGSRLIHFSSDCVYSGENGFFKETDSTFPSDLYGRAKALGEVSGPKSLTIRSSIIGPELESCQGLFEWIYSQRGKRIKGYKNSIFSGLTTLAMSKIIIDIVENFPQLSGIWNIASHPISKYELVCMINKAMNLNITVEEDLSHSIDRSLDGRRFQLETGIIIPSWQVMIDQMVDINSFPRFCIVLPMYNEEANVEASISKIYNHLKTRRFSFGIIAVNDGSSDKTLEKLQEALKEVPVLVIENHIKNMGYGAANITGARRGYMDGYEYILFMDADQTQKVTYVDDFVIEMKKGIDFIKATRYSKGGGVIGVPFKRRAISYFGNKLAKIFFRLPLNDYTNGFRAMKSKFVPELNCSEKGFAYLIEEVSQLKKFAKSYSEVPYILSVRMEGESTSKFSYSYKTFINYLKYLVKG